MKQQILAVQRMQDYIASHLEQDICLSQLAKVSQFSPWHSHRLFTFHTGITPGDYIRRLRLSRSALRLRDEGCTITSAALDAGFKSVDRYQRAFLREFGCNPSEYARFPVPVTLFIPYGVNYKHPKKEARLEMTKTVFVQEMQKPARKVIIKRGKTATEYFQYCEEVGCDVWGLLSSIQSIDGEPVCLWLPQAYIQPGTSQYVQGAQVPLEYAGVIPAGFDIIQLPAARYLLFKGEPFEEEFYGQAILDLQQAVAKYNPETLGAQWDDSNPIFQLQPIGSRGYMELHPIR